MFDIAHALDRAVLDALAREFAFELHLYDRDYTPVRRCRVSGDLADNVRRAIGAAEAALEEIDRSRRSFARACIAWSEPGFDRHGLRDVERARFRRDVLERLDSPQQVARALHMVRHFSQPELEERLLLVWGEPASRWNQQRARVVQAAVETGLWPGPDLVSAAIEGGAARSRRELVARIRAAFARTLARADNDLADAAVEANRVALAGEVTRAASEEAAGNGNAVVSGVIGGDEMNTGPTKPISNHLAQQAMRRAAAMGRAQIAPSARPNPAAVDPAGSAGAAGGAGGDSAGWLAMLDDKDNRREAAIRLAELGEASALAPLFAALRQMTRSEAVQVLGNVVRFGVAAEPYLLEELRSRKSFLRQGSALALAVLASERGAAAICDQLIVEPTDIWRELARSVGEYGARAVPLLLARIQSGPALTDANRERLAWAMAHVGAHGGLQAVEAAAASPDPVVVGIARHALELADLARSDQRSVRGGASSRDVTVNRAFSRKFFEAMNESADGADAPANGHGEVGSGAALPGRAPEAGSRVPSRADEDDALVLDDADLIEEAT